MSSTHAVTRSGKDSNSNASFHNAQLQQHQADNNDGNKTSNSSSSSSSVKGRQNNRKPLSMWYAEDGKVPEVQVAVTGMNLQGSGQTKGIFFKTELKQTIFQMLVSFHCYTWSVFRSFDEFKDFYYFLRDDSTLGHNRKMLKAPFPPGEEGETDVMVLVERRDYMEDIIKEAVQLINIHTYEPLSQFLQAESHLGEVKRNLSVLGTVIRRYAARRKHNMRLFKFYSKEMLKFTYVMEGGVDVFCVSSSITDGNNSNNGLYRAPAAVGTPTSSSTSAGFSSTTTSTAAATPAAEDGIPEEFVLWIDICDEAALSRLCIAPRAVFELPRDCEDERLSTGIFLCDIAEVRHGISSYGFQRNSHRCSWIKPSLCVSVVGSERTIDFQLMDEHDVKRSLFVDILNLLALQALTPAEIKLRQKRFARCAPHESVRNCDHKLTKKETSDAERLQKLLVKGIEVDEEAYSPYYGVTTLAKRLSYSVEERRLNIAAIDSLLATPVSATRAVGSSSNSSTGAMQQQQQQQQQFTPPKPTAVAYSSGSAEGMHASDEELVVDVDVDVDGTTCCTSNVDGDEEEEHSSEHNSYSNSARNSSFSLPPPIGVAHVGTSPVGVYMMGNMHMLNNSAKDVTSSDRSIAIDDISEVRPGKIGCSVDGADDAQCLSIVASETILILPTASTAMRDTLIRRFQAFVKMHRDFEALCTDHPNTFRKKVQKQRRTASSSSSAATATATTNMRGSHSQSNIAAAAAVAAVAEEERLLTVASTAATASTAKERTGSTTIIPISTACSMTTSMSTPSTDGVGMGMSQRTHSTNDAVVPTFGVASPQDCVTSSGCGADNADSDSSRCPRRNTLTGSTPTVQQQQQQQSVIFSHYKAARSVSHIRRSSHTSLRGSSMSGAGGSFSTPNSSSNNNNIGGSDSLMGSRAESYGGGGGGGSGKTPRLLSMDEGEEI